MTVTTWRYYLPNDKQLEGWAIVFLDSTGCFTTVSDWGNYGYLWTGHGSGDFRAWLIDRGDDYLLSKLAPPRRSARGRHDPQAGQFIKRVMPRLREAIRAELHAEDVQRTAEEIASATGLSVEDVRAVAESTVDGAQPKLSQGELLNLARQMAAMAERENGPQIVHCTYCNKTHAVKPGEKPCAPGAWIDPTPIGGSR